MTKGTAFLSDFVGMTYGLAKGVGSFLTLVVWCCIGLAVFATVANIEVTDQLVAAAIGLAITMQTWQLIYGAAYALLEGDPKLLEPNKLGVPDKSIMEQLTIVAARQILTERELFEGLKHRVRAKGLPKLFRDTLGWLVAQGIWTQRNVNGVRCYMSINLEGAFDGSNIPADK